MYTNIIHNDDICNYFLKNQQFIFNSLGNCRECREYGLTQEDLALKCGVGLNFVRQLEQGKPTLRMDKVNQVLALFGYELAPVRTDELNENS